MAPIHAGAAASVKPSTAGSPFFNKRFIVKSSSEYVSFGTKIIEHMLKYIHEYEITYILV
ncbi:hypothetical protein GCM10007362_39670 [Saccharibacillus endophyticus]|uniref:Uncharacterized protein n=1 Tax=Saccharibacillus endophyticus TaxID=2060666 RepID=A0ABQ2A1R1_9BACL|nr:hypothetical protein GCM10007362_39670 [Saccharibacillus endophyticus]